MREKDTRSHHTRTQHTDTDAHLYTHTQAVLIKEVFISLCQTVTVCIVWVHKDGSFCLHISTAFFFLLCEKATKSQIPNLTFVR